jgi:hypothetical protein
LVLPETDEWKPGPLIKELPRDLVGDHTIRKIKLSKSAREFNVVVRNEIGNFQSDSRSNPSIDWFRQVVNRYTSIGHDDVALSKSLLTAISRKCDTKYSAFYCPWLFHSDFEMTQYILKKFAFILDNRKIIADSDVHKKIKPRRKEIGGGKTCWAFDWNLCIVLLRDKKSEKAKVTKRRILIVLTVLNLLMIGRLTGIMLGLSEEGIYSNLERLIYLVIGLTVNDLREYFRFHRN